MAAAMELKIGGWVMMTLSGARWIAGTRAVKTGVSSTQATRERCRRRGKAANPVRRRRERRTSSRVSGREAVVGEEAAAWQGIGT